MIQNFEFHYFFRFFRKINIFLGYEDFVDIFAGLSQNLTIFRGHFYVCLIFIFSHYALIYNLSLSAFISQMTNDK